MTDSLVDLVGNVQEKQPAKGPFPGDVRPVLGLALLVLSLTLVAGCTRIATPDSSSPTAIGTTEARPTPGQAGGLKQSATPTPVPSPLPTVGPVVEPSATREPERASDPQPTGEGPIEIPVRIKVPRIGVNAAIETVGLDQDGTMGVPRRFEDVGWYGFGPIPGQAGVSVLAGHVDSVHGPAVFWSLRDLRPGDVVEVDLLGDTVRRFVVEGLGSFASGEAPISAIFSWDGPPRLALITCGGVFDRALHAYDHRLIVYARMVRSSPMTRVMPNPADPAG